MVLLVRKTHMSYDKWSLLYTIVRDTLGLSHIKYHLINLFLGSVMSTLLGLLVFICVTKMIIQMVAMNFVMRATFIFMDLDLMGVD